VTNNPIAGPEIWREASLATICGVFALLMIPSCKKAKRFYANKFIMSNI
jgi:hypothetical protein